MASKEKELNYIYLENTSPGHNKFYEMKVEVMHDGRFTVHLNWGRIGSKGSASSKLFKSEAQGRIFLKSTLKSKQDKGYKLVKREGKTDKITDEISTDKSFNRFTRAALEW